MDTVLYMLAFALGAISHAVGSIIIQKSSQIFVIMNVNSDHIKTAHAIDHSSRVRACSAIPALTAGVAFGMILHMLGGGMTAFSTLLPLPMMLLIARLDWQKEIVPDIFVLVLLALGGVRLWLLGLDILDVLLGGVASAAIMALLMAASAWRRGQQGTSLTSEIAWGDVTLMFGLGFLVGRTSLLGFWLCAGVAHLLAFAVTPKGRQALRTDQALPMAPALCLGAAVMLLANDTGALPWASSP